MKPTTLLIYNVEIAGAGRAPFMGRVLVEGDTIAAVEPTPSADGIEADVKIDGRRALLLPGGIDEHVHFREPGMTSKATIATESRAAAAGGITSWIDMPNTSPATTSRDLIEEKIKLAEGRKVGNMGLMVGATASNLDELRAVDYSRAVAGVKLFIGATTGSLVLDTDEALDRLFATAPAVIAVHAEDNAIIEANRRRLLAEQGDGADDLPVDMHPEVRSREACVAATRRAIDLALKHNARLHIMHISTADELDLLRSQPPGARVTAETCPQYLLFDSADYQRLGTRVKCNPAIKSPADRLALIEAVRSGLIDTIGSDHAPHLPADKRGGALKAASGMPMIQFSLPLMLDLLGPELVAEKMAAAPARIFGIKDRGAVKPGYRADLTLVERLDEPYTITDGDVVSKCGWTPVAGMKCRHRVMLTLVNGRPAFSALDGVEAVDDAADILSFST